MCSRAGEFQLFEVDATESQWELKWAERLEQFYKL